VIFEELGRESEDGIDPKRYRVIELEMIGRDGSRIWVEVTACFLRDKDKNPDRILGITRDITQRKTLEKKLMESYTDLRIAQRIACVGNFSFDPEKGVPVWSDEIYRIYERNSELGPVAFSEYQTFLSTTWWEKFNIAIQGAIEKGLPCDMELKLTLPSGKVKWVNAICEPEPDPGPKGHYLRGTIQDITDRKKMAVNIQQAQKMEALGTLAGGIAHDFNNILSSILGFTELAKLDAMGDDDMINHLNQVLAAGLRARDLVKHILTFSRKSDAQKDLIRIVPLVKECLKFLKASVSPDINIQTNFTQPDMMVLADPSQIHQVFMNLLTNAAFAMKENGGVLDVQLKSVNISAEDVSPAKEIMPGQYAQLTISDTGCGISKNVIGKIFEPFFTTKVKGEGTGMGLSMVYGIIKELQGNISVYSEPGMGSTFQILIPEQTHKIEKDEDSYVAMLITGKGRILIADDEPSIIEWTSKALMKIGYEVVGVNNGLEAFEKFKQDPMSFDLILTDLAMPRMTGLELSSLIKAERPDIPIVLCTGFSEGLTSQMINDYGISDMVMKPMIASELARILSDSLNKNRNRINV